jgi:hypothetical protein
LELQESAIRLPDRDGDADPAAARTPGQRDQFLRPGLAVFLLFRDLHHHHPAKLRDPSHELFFLAAAFFAFHLLLAYLADHLDIRLAFLISSAVSISLVTTYLRVVAGTTFALREAAAAQFIYLVLFSSAFFFKGFTGLAITIGAILTLFVVMQMTASIRWSERFAQATPPPIPASGS